MLTLEFTIRSYALSQSFDLPADLAARLARVQRPTVAQLVAPPQTIHFEYRLSPSIEALRPGDPVRISRYGAYLLIIVLGRESRIMPNTLNRALFS